MATMSANNITVKITDQTSCTTSGSGTYNNIVNFPAYGDPPWNTGGTGGPYPTTWQDHTTTGTPWDFDSTIDKAKIIELEQKIEELQKKVRSAARKKIDKIEIESLSDFHFFMVTVLKKLKDHLGEEEMLDDNLDFLIEELVIELDKMLDEQIET